jgi:hypothetical protein
MEPSSAAGRCPHGHDRTPVERSKDTNKGLEKHWNLVEESDCQDRHFTDLFVIALLSLGAATVIVVVHEFHRQLKQSR